MSDIADNPIKQTSGALGETMDKKEQLIERLLEHDVLVSPDDIDVLSPEEVEQYLADPTSFGKSDNKTSADKPPTPNLPPVEIIYNYDKESKKRVYDDFVSMFRKRYESLSRMLRQRQELAGVISISRALAKRDEVASIIGMVKTKRFTKNKNYIITVEDPTGEITVVVSNSKREPTQIAEDMVLDEVVGIIGKTNGTTLFADRIVFPDIPMTHELKQAPYEASAIFLGDPQVGGDGFLEEEWDTFIEWLNGNVGNEKQRAVAKSVQYIIIPGDCVEGVGVYPGQEEDLVVKDIKEQYNLFARYLERFPKNISIIICPGNHDAGRISEPQPPLYKDFAEKLYDMPNVTIISSPGTVRIGKTKTFPGFTVLLYHGYSLIYYSDNIPSVRNAGGQKATEMIMRFLLQRRHLAPTHGSNRYIPDAEEDPLVINNIPDFFITGHIHRAAVGNYRNITMINASAWTDITEDQEKRGLEPQPARLPIVDLKTREVKVMNFYKGKKVKEEKA